MTTDTLPITFRRADWITEAACRDTDPNKWVPEANAGHSMDAQRQICLGCPVRQECAEFAIADSTLLGMWGGLSYRQRRAIRSETNGGKPGPVAGSRPRVAKCGTSAGYKAHRRRNEEACHECKAAHARRVRENQQKNRR